MDKKTLEYIIKLRDQASAGFKRIGSTAGRTMRSVKNAIFSVKSALVGVAAYLIGRYVRSWVEAAKKQEDAIQKVLAMAKSQGTMYKGLRAEIEKTTAALQAKTTYGDEAQMEAMAKMVATGADVTTAMKDMGLVMDLAAGAGMDLGTAGMYVARAMIGQPEMLARYVPAIRDLAKEERDWATVKGILTKQFKGTAEAIAATPFGLMSQIANLWGDIKEKFGAFIAEWLANTGVLDAMKDIFISIGEGLGSIKTGAEEGVAPSKAFGLAMIDVAIAVTETVIALEKLKKPFDDVNNWLEEFMAGGELERIWEIGERAKEMRGELYGPPAPGAEVALQYLLEMRDKYMNIATVLDSNVIPAVDDMGKTGATATRAFIDEVKGGLKPLAAVGTRILNIGLYSRKTFPVIKEQIDHMSDAMYLFGNVSSLVLKGGTEAARMFSRVLRSTIEMIKAIQAMKAMTGGPLGIIAAGLSFFLKGGGIIPAQHGVILNKPTMIRHNVMGGEGNSAEAVVPLNEEGLLKFAKGMIQIVVHEANPSTYVDIIVKDSQAIGRLGEGIREWNIDYAQR